MKKIVSSILACISLFCMVTLLYSCNNKDGESKSPVAGEFLWLDEAYENGWLNSDNLKKIADTFNDLYKDSTSEEFLSKVEKLPLLDETIMKNVAKAYQDKYNQITNYEDISVVKSYYGSYQNCYVIDISSRGDPYIHEEYSIGGITFYNYHALGVYKITVKGE